MRAKCIQFVAPPAPPGYSYEPRSPDAREQVDVSATTQLGFAAYAPETSAPPRVRPERFVRAMQAMSPELVRALAVWQRPSA